MTDASHVVTEDDIRTDPGGHAPWAEPDDLPAVVDARTVALTYARLTARQDRVEAELQRAIDLLLELLQAVRTRPCLVPTDPCPLHAVGAE